MALYKFEDKIPIIGEDCWIAETADVIGDVRIGDRCYIGPGAQLKGDYGSVVIGDGTSVQETCVLHTRPDEVCFVGDQCTIGHGAILHGCTIRDRAVVGMGAIVSDWAEVGEGAMIGEGAVVRQSDRIPAGKVAVGVPARVIGEVSDEGRDFQALSRRVYPELALRYRKSLVKL